MLRMLAVVLATLFVGLLLEGVLAFSQAEPAPAQQMSPAENWSPTGNSITIRI